MKDIIDTLTQALQSEGLKPEGFSFETDTDANIKCIYIDFESGGDFDIKFVPEIPEPWYTGEN